MKIKNIHQWKEFQMISSEEVIMKLKTRKPPKGSSHTQFKNFKFQTETLIKMTQNHEIDLKYFKETNWRSLEKETKKEEEKKEKKTKNEDFIKFVNKVIPNPPIENELKKWK